MGTGHASDAIGGRKGIQSLVGGLGEAQGDEEKSFQEQVHGKIHKTTSLRFEMKNLLVGKNVAGEFGLNLSRSQEKTLPGFFPGSSNILMKDMCDDTHILF